jgi:shikimate kinase
MKLIFVGPCGVGKSTVAKSLANRVNIAYLNFDEFGTLDMETRKGQVSPFSASRLNLMQSIPNIISSTTYTDFALDIGGDTVFRKTTDNKERFKQVLWVKKTYSSHIIVLTAKKDILLSRFISTKSRNNNDFDEIWENWLIAEPYWQKCGDIVIDTSFLTVDKTIEQIESYLNRSVW